MQLKGQLLVAKVAHGWRKDGGDDDDGGGGGGGE